MKSRLIVIDVETGGFDPSKNALLSVAAVDSMDNEAFTAIIRPNPEWLCEPDALAKNGFTLDFLEKNGRPERDVMQDLALWLGERRYSVLAGCNVAFDRDFLRAAFARNELTWPMGKMVDLQATAWLAYEVGALPLSVGKDGQPRLNLDHIAGSLGFSRSGKIHNALEDALMTLACFHRLRRRVEMAPETITA
jgi:DNA polymerase III epsilon subunit-like protein